MEWVKQLLMYVTRKQNHVTVLYMHESQIHKGNRWQENSLLVMWLTGMMHAIQQREEGRGVCMV